MADERAHVLYVAAEDTVARALDAAGTFVRHVSDPDAVPSTLDSVRVDCVVSEYRLPGTTGVDLLERVRETRPDLPFVLYAAEGDEHVASDAIAAGVDDYVVQSARDGESAQDARVELLRDRIERVVERARGPGSAAVPVGGSRIGAQVARPVEAEREGPHDRSRGGVELPGEENSSVSGGDARYRRLLEATPIPIAIFDRDAVRFVNGACREFLGVTDEERIVGQDPFEFFSVSEVDTVEERMARILDRRESLDPREYRITTATGEVRHVVMRSEPVTFDGRAAGQVVINDVTEYRETEAELERERRTLQTALDTVDDFFFILDADGDPTRCNRSVTAVTGYDDAELEALSMEAFFADDQAERVRSAVDRMLREGSATVEAEVVTADDERIPFEFRGVRMTDENDRVVGGCAIGRDVGGQRAYERDLERYRALMETMADAVYVVDERGELVDVNQALVEKSGYERADLLGAPVTRFMDADDIQAVTELVMEILTDPERSSGNIEFETTDAEGRRRIVEDSVSVLTDDDGNYESTVGVLRDVTEERERERQLRRQNERLDRFAGLVSHDLRNPINVVQGFVDLAEETGDPEAFDRIRSSTERMESLVDDMLALARHGQVVSDAEPVALERVAREAWSRVRTDDATLVVEADRTFEADPERLAALFENLYRNAVEHGAAHDPDGAEVTDADADADVDSEVAGSGVTVRVTATERGFAVADDGRGLPAERNELFRYGVTHEEGTGLGLAIVAEICEAHGWTVEAGDSADGGARFDVYL